MMQGEMPEDLLDFFFTFHKFSSCYQVLHMYLQRSQVERHLSPNV
jgi:hypothetical protein